MYNTAQRGNKMKDVKEKVRDIEDETRIYNICLILASSGKNRTKKRRYSNI